MSPAKISAAFLFLTVMVLFAWPESKAAAPVKALRFGKLMDVPAKA